MANSGMPNSCCGARRMSSVFRPSSPTDRCHSLPSLFPPPAAVGSLPKCRMPNAGMGCTPQSASLTAPLQGSLRGDVGIAPYVVEAQDTMLHFPQAGNFTCVMASPLPTKAVRLCGVPGLYQGRFSGRETRPLRGEGEPGVRGHRRSGAPTGGGGKREMPNTGGWCSAFGIIL